MRPTRMPRATMPRATCTSGRRRIARQRGIQELRPELERTHARGNAERHGDAADDRQPRIPREQAPGELEVERESAEPGEPAAVAQRFLMHLDAAKRDQRLAPGLAG